MSWKRRPGASNPDTLSLVVPDVTQKAGKPRVMAWTTLKTLPMESDKALNISRAGGRVRAVSSRTAMDPACSAASGELQDLVQTILRWCFYFFPLMVYRTRGLAALEMQSPEVIVVFMITAGIQVCNKLHSWQYGESAGGQISPSPTQ